MFVKIRICYIFLFLKIFHGSFTVLFFVIPFTQDIFFSQQYRENPIPAHCKFKKQYDKVETDKTNDLGKTGILNFLEGKSMWTSE